MIELDGTPNKSSLGANAILAVSLAAARGGGADRSDLPLYRYLGGPLARVMPVPMMNILNGGAHATNTVDFQEFMIVPVGAESFAEALRMGTEVFHALKKVLVKRKLATGVGDEGGFAPDLRDDEEAIKVILEAIDAAGYAAGKEIALALDCAASELFVDGTYTFKKSGAGKQDAAGHGRAVRAVDRRVSDRVDRGRPRRGRLGRLGEAHAARSAIGASSSATICSSRTPSGSRAASRTASRNAILIKVNQIGTLSETLEAIEMARAAGYLSVISHRSGETEDTFIADLAVGDGRRADQDRIGEPDRSRREVQPAAPHRGAAGRRRRVSGRRAVWHLSGAGAAVIRRDRRLGSRSRSALSRSPCEGGEFGTTDLDPPAPTRKRGSVGRSTRCSGVVDSLDGMRRAVSHDPATQERIAREVFGMVRGRQGAALPVRRQRAAPEAPVAGSARPASSPGHGSRDRLPADLAVRRTIRSSLTARCAVAALRAEVARARDTGSADLRHASDVARDALAWRLASHREPSRTPWCARSDSRSRRRLRMLVRLDAVERRADSRGGHRGRCSSRSSGGSRSHPRARLVDASPRLVTDCCWRRWRSGSRGAAGFAPEPRPIGVLGLIVLVLAVLIRCAAGLAAELFTMRAFDRHGARRADDLPLRRSPAAFTGGCRSRSRALAIPLPELVTQALALPLQFRASRMGAALLQMRQCRCG